MLPRLRRSIRKTRRRRLPGQPTPSAVSPLFLKSRRCRELGFSDGLGMGSHKASQRRDLVRRRGYAPAKFHRRRLVRWGATVDLSGQRRRDKCGLGRRSVHSADYRNDVTLTCYNATGRRRWPPQPARLRRLRLAVGVSPWKLGAPHRSRAANAASADPPHDPPSRKEADSAAYRKHRLANFRVAFPGHPT